MTTASESVELTRVGPGTVMGKLMREYWIPALMSSELPRGGAPLRLMLLGEKLIAFRDGDGRAGVMDHRCPHRCASLFLGRNEQDGLRCVYHGWKFDVTGKCLDMPNVPPQQDFSHKVRAKAYPTAERAGMVWVYMGVRAEAPPLPAFEVLGVPDDEVGALLIQRNCNYLQALEGDAADDPILHTVAIRTPDYHGAAGACGAVTGIGRAPAGVGDALRLPARRARRGRRSRASAISCFHSGHRCRTAHSPVICRCAAGSRSTTSTPCIACCGGNAARRR
jgi:phthalate 4,5-dioxygenase